MFRLGMQIDTRGVGRCPGSTRAVIYAGHLNRWGSQNGRSYRSRRGSRTAACGLFSSKHRRGATSKANERPWSTEAILKAGQYLTAWSAQK